MHKDSKEYKELFLIIKDKLKIHAHNIDTVIDFIYTLIKSKTVNLSTMSDHSLRLSDNIKPLSVYKNFQRLIHGLDLQMEQITDFIIEIINPNKEPMNINLVI